MTWLRARSRSLPGWIPFVLILGWMAASGDRNLLHVGTLIAIWTLWGMSLNVIWGYSGQFSMAQVGLGAISAYTTAILVTKHAWPVWPAVGVAIVVTVAASLVIGLVSLRLSGFYFSIMTLAFALLVLSYIRTLDAAGRSTGIASGFDFGTIAIGGVHWGLSSRNGGYLLFCAALGAFFLLVLGRIELSRSGRALVAMREDPVLASSVGVQVSLHRLFAFVVSAVIAAVAGITYAAYFRFISPDFFAFGTLITVIVQVTLGGRGHRFGPFVGAFIYIGIVEWLHFGGNYSGGFFGVMLIAIVMFAPMGVLGTGAQLLRRRAERRPLTGRAGPPGRVVDLGTETAEADLVRG